MPLMRHELSTAHRRSVRGARAKRNAIGAGLRSCEAR
jgi:hypothetical protein